MRPELFRFFDVGFPSYFVLLLSGFFFATGLGVLWAKRIGLNPDVIVDLGLAMLLAGVAGSRLLHVLVHHGFHHPVGEDNLAVAENNLPLAADLHPDQLTLVEAVFCGLLRVQGD